MLKTADINIRDPFVLVHDGKYYMYGTFGAQAFRTTRGRFDVYVGTDLENWDGPFECFAAGDDFWADRDFWAPEVHEWQGRFYMFASFKADNICRCTAILAADSPMGPFVPHSDGPVTPRDWECLDGTFYVSRDGKPYMVFCHEWVQVVDGEIWAVPLSMDLKRADGEMTLMFRASEAEWCRPVKEEDGKKFYVTDGPYLRRTPDGKLNCLWASFSEGGYTEAVAVSEDGEITGRFRQEKTLFKKDGGHGMLFTGLDGNLYLTMHRPNNNPDERPIFLKMQEDETGLSLA